MIVGIAARLTCLLAATVLIPLSPPQTPAALTVVGVQRVAVVGGQPDDITADAHGNLIWGDLARGTVRELTGGRITTLARGLSVPEGVVVLPDGALVVAEQGRDRVIRIDRGGKRTILVTLRPVAGQEGVDGIGWDARNGRVLVPDSPRGTVLAVSPDGRSTRVLARGLGRPVAVMPDAHGDVLIPDEHLGTLVVVTPRGTVVDRGAFSTPDDVAVARDGRVWITTLGDYGLWTIVPGATAPFRILFDLANPQGLTLDRCDDPIVVEQNTARIVRVLLTATSARCPL